ncbi:MAG TPA: FHA domain-containing protein [Candidatus Eremiobacteraceae bacterium]|nr:FHA domain-containing protein [Candidatus Eremiobacteraceae bacterium]
MIQDALAVRWESLAMALGALALALWAFRSPAAAQQVDQPEHSDAVVLRVQRPGQGADTLEARDGCLLGRGRDCDIAFDDASVSKMHARLHVAEGVATIEDLDSTNGTLLNGKRLDGMAPLRRGDRIGLGTNQIVYLGAPSHEDV